MPQLRGNEPTLGLNTDWIGLLCVDCVYGANP
jgi:hypothetical protein